MWLIGGIEVIVSTEGLKAKKIRNDIFEFFDGRMYRCDNFDGIFYIRNVNPYGYIPIVIFFH